MCPLLWVCRCGVGRHMSVTAAVGGLLWVGRYGLLLRLGLIVGKHNKT